MQQVPQIRIFLSSPGDVNDERTIARKMIEDLPYRPLLRDKISVRIVAWDKAVASTPFRARLKPQEAINKGLPRPSECDINLVIFWSRLGTEFTDEQGVSWQSGTHWELHDAMFNAPHDRTVIYRSLIKPKSLKDPFSPDYDANKVQWDRLNQFLKSDLFLKDGQPQRSLTEYKKLDEFRDKLAIDLETFIVELLAEHAAKAAPTASPALTASEQVIVVPDDLWQGSPFPGLRAFDVADSPIFFGRGRETDDLLTLLENNRFVAVVAASGSGKSSLVAAGLIPRLRAGAIAAPDTNSQAWRIVRFTPGQDKTSTGQDKNPFAALFTALCAAFPEREISSYSLPKERKNFVESLTSTPSAILEICDDLLKKADAPAWAEVLFFIDQFEELFTVVTAADRTAFVVMLEAMQGADRLRCIVTMRSDFYANCLDLPPLATILKDATYPLAAPTVGALYAMITRPAERAGLQWEDGLPDRILGDTKDEPGALALLAYALDELYHASHAREDKRLTAEAYRAIGGVEGAIGKRAEDVFAALTLPDKERVLQAVFRELVAVNPSTGAATRQTAALDGFKAEERALIHVLATARLLVTEDNGVEVAHEAVFRSWARLKQWIAESQEDLILLRQVRTAAAEWRRDGKPDSYRWPSERLKPVTAMVARQQPSLKDYELDFIEPEQTRLLREIDDIRTSHQRRRWIGERLATIGDPRKGIGLDERGLPDIVWLPVQPGGKITIAKKEFTVQPFYVAKYLVTFAQFEAFRQAMGGFEDERWWQGFPAKYVKQTLSPAAQQYDNYPRDMVSWYQTVAFARWLDAQYRQHGLFAPFPADDWQIRLPTEWEWQWMAQNGVKKWTYPWGDWDEHPRANTTGAGIGDRATAVGMYPHGAAACEALDVAGNLREWCLNKYHEPEQFAVDASGASRLLRGGSFDSGQGSAAAGRLDLDPDYVSSVFGCRLVVGRPPSL